MLELEHIGLDRMKEVGTQCEAYLTEDEQFHLNGCLECLDVFGRLILLSDDEYRFSTRPIRRV